MTLGGVDLRDLDPEDVRAAVRVAGQDAHVFATSLRENLRLARPSADDETLLEALERVGLDPWVAELPDGLSTLLGEGGATVSGGQRQRIGVARALLGGGRFLVLDEPTAHLDGEGAADVPGRAGRRSPATAASSWSRTSAACRPVFDRVVALA